jgi:uncharacterized alkaline shock family protein YloU
VFPIVKECRPMTTAIEQITPRSSSASGGIVAPSVHATGGGQEPVGVQGRTTVADTVVQKIAGRAAREVSGVYDFGGGAARTFGAITERIPGGRASSSRGVTVEVGEKQAAIDLEIVVEYGVPIGQLAQAIRRNVIGAVETMTGLQVVEVNISVNDLHLPDEDSADEDSADEPAQPPRVR